MKGEIVNVLEKKLDFLINELMFTVLQKLHLSYFKNFTLLQKFHIAQFSE